MRSPRRGPFRALVLVALAAAAQAQPVRRPPRPPGCAPLGRPDHDGRFVAREDLTPAVPYEDGDDWLALVNRSPRGALAPGYAPRDLVDLRTLRPAAPASCVPPERQCLRREAALALRALGAALRAATGEGLYLDSAFRGYATQCAVFGKWAWRERQGFCPTAVSSALPGRSQHQLGTAIDVFTPRWVRGGRRFRDGFGCTPAGRWLADNAWSFGYVLPYPLHPDHRAPGSDCLARPDARARLDPRTGYKYEPWHIRYVGRAHAARFREAWTASGPGSATEITLEQWIRLTRGAADLVEPPVCDGCACGACATLRPRGAATPDPCPGGDGVLTIDPATGAPTAPTSEPALREVGATREEGGAVLLRARVEVPADTLTQPPVVTRASGVRYGAGQSFEALVGAPGGLARAYPDLPGAVRLAVAREGDGGWPWRAALAGPTRDAEANGVNARVPATTGSVAVSVPVEGVAAGAALVVALVREGRVVGAPVTLRAP